VPRPKVWTRIKRQEVVLKMARRRGLVWDNPVGGEIDFAVDVRRLYKKNSSVLSYVGKRKKEGCDLDSEVGISTIGSFA